MPYTLEQAIAEILVNGDPARNLQGLATRDGWGLYNDPDPDRRHVFIGEEPDNPDDCVTVLLEAGGAPVAGGLGHGVARRPSFTIRSRALTAEDASSRIFYCYEILDEYEGTANGVPIFRANANFDPLALGRDREQEGGRWVWTQTYRTITKRYSLQ